MSARFRTPIARSAAPSRPALTRRRHVDLMRVHGDGCRRRAAR